MKLPQLSLRDLFWLVAMVAMGLGWWITYNKWHATFESERSAFEERIAATESKLTALDERMRQIKQAIFQAGFVVDDREDFRSKRVVNTVLVPRDDGPMRRNPIPASP